MSEELSNCCYAPLVPCEDSTGFFTCSSCGQLADPATDAATAINDPGERHFCHWCQKTTDHRSCDCPVKLAQVEAATHQL